jgi:acyl-CoA synthetase (AMP-forming)/AMP-acid ligase II
MNLVTHLETWANQCPDALALCDVHEGQRRSMTFHTLLQRVCGVSRQFRQRGLEPGQTVFLFYPITIEFYVTMLGALHAGLVVMLADPSAGRAFIVHCCARKKVDAFVGIRKAHALRLLVPALRRVTYAFHEDGYLPFSDVLKKEHDHQPAYECADDHPALITFTSGSTGVPKAAVRTHGFLLAQHRSLSQALRLQQGEVDLVTLPVFCLANLASGLCSVLADMNFAHPAKADAEKIARQCEDHGVTRCSASPAFFEALLRGPMPSFQSIYTGGAPVFPDLIERLTQALPDAQIVSVYGSTEAEPIADCRDASLDDLHRASAQGRGLCAGEVVEDIRCKVMRDSWGEALSPMQEKTFLARQCAAGEAGEIVVSGDHVLKGYLDGLGDHETKFRVGDTIWHRTGDAGYLDENGRLWLLGRCSEKMQLANGSVLYPFSLECVIRHRWPQRRAAVISHRGRHCLIVEKYESMNPAEWQEFVTDHHLDDLHWIEKIPLDRRHNAKVDYTALRAWLESTNRD